MFILEQSGKYTVLSMRVDNSLVVLFSNNVPVAMRIGTGESENDAILVRDAKTSPMTERHIDKFIERFQLAGMLVPLWPDAFDKDLVQYLTTFRLDKML